ncbi:xanthine dehydrogenase accessory protein XdhC [Ruegeria pomeroyi]|uniref:Xanthine dehydrogenase accessory factor n=2 Tax=Ruegeria pomeroyi TaxID=89184 RepID=Q5LVP8_RUEPO|nr:xanthine dehydrogenase accessory protein XdhC [Ruegeria pomeroyi]AAV93960.1 xanthine dehydrogenase accessory factor [Ruegeria pomeroyi DSS-3]NVK98423.1 xanthine dehydrogenase accessory protein XdhC [Ruegeria pomeroyi]NVL02844.1 xanthine dehydrogenase accessory protein XdhC [Ruegeria pomeroyi]QWV07548.1 xanthine dehydrogenase accessory protein XdhC [Ruegeria pomeroyi]
MAFDLEGLRAAVAAHGRVTRVVIAAIRGSSPREVGAAMLVWENGQSGTIGGGALEFQAAEAARAGRLGLSRHALGPELGQCCGGAVTLLTESWDAARLDTVEGTVVARPALPFSGTENGPETLQVSGAPLALRRLLAQARGQGVLPKAQLVGDWMVEPVLRPARQLWIWGAGHVGRALVDVLSPLPEIAITWVDTGVERFPETIPAGVTPLPAAQPADLVGYAPKEAEHLILTYSHELDLELCNRLLRHDFAFAGLIGSATKWARFRSRLAALGHGPQQIARITCPIGDPALGKHPASIAIGVAARLLSPAHSETTRKELSA